MSRTSIATVLAGIGSWLVFALAVAVGGFGLLENIGATSHVSNWQFFLAMALAAISSLRLIRVRWQSGILSLGFVGGVAGLVLPGTLAALALV